MHITIDIKPEDVLKLDEDGMNLSFAHEPDKFLDLPKEIYSKLNEKNLQAYKLARFDYKEECEIKSKDLIPSDVNIFTKFMLASEQLKVENMPDHLHGVWKRPDELPIFERIGYKVWKKGDPGNPVMTNGRIGKAGDEVLILMWTTKENHMRYIREVENRSKAMAGLPVKDPQSGEVTEQDLKN